LDNWTISSTENLNENKQIGYLFSLKNGSFLEKQCYGNFSAKLALIGVDNSNCSSACWRKYFYKSQWLETLGGCLSCYIFRKCAKSLNSQKREQSKANENLSLAKKTLISVE
jgi:hypothetical protein